MLARIRAVLFKRRCSTNDERVQDTLEYFKLGCEDQEEGGRN